MSDYRGKHIWIIGASSGIGRALAVEISGRGATLALSARSGGQLEKLNADLGGHHGVFPVDIANTQETASVTCAIKEKFATIDSVIFVAALYEPAALNQIDIKKTRLMFDVNVIGAFNLIHSVLPILKQQHTAQLALCGSVAGIRGLPAGQPYSATKAAIINLAESLKAENDSLDVKLINPGFVRTALTNKNTFKMPMMIEPEQAAKTIANGLLTKRFEIHFPARFTYMVKFLSLLPNFIYFKLVRRLTSDETH